MKGMRIPDEPDVPETRGQGVGLALFGLMFVAGGAYVEYLSFVSPPKGNDDPPWLTGLAGLLFLVPGLWLVLNGMRAIFNLRADAETDRVYRGGFVAIVLWLFALSFGGVAFFASEGSVRGSITGTSAEGRILFGIAAGAIAICAFFFSRVVARAIRSRKQRRS